jgi:3'-phosphoadenosine 5'-phosphosulfate sulfotransferase (PAPS reductase)/FAD synthetase
MGQTKSKGLIPMSKPEYYIASFSGGKDSTAMVLELIARGYPLDEVLCCDTTVEFPAMYRHIEKVRKVVDAAGIKFTILRAEHDFEYYLLHDRVKRRGDGYHDKLGRSWPDSRVRWCTGKLKNHVIAKYKTQLKKQYTLVEYDGLAADEAYRLERDHNKSRRHPLVEWGWTEGMALSYCYEKGYDWEGLYEIFRRVSCWLCPLQPLGELRKLRLYFPDLWRKLREMDAQTWREYKEGYTVALLDKRFAFEEAMEAAGQSTTNRQFYIDLKRHCFEGVPVD